MARAAFMVLTKLEARHLMRSTRGRLVMATLGVLVLSASFVGRAIVGTHTRAGDRDASSSITRVGEAAKNNATAPVPQTAFDLSAWSDTFIARGATPSSLWVAGDLSALPDSAAVRIFEPPSLVPSVAERSPAAIILGILDLAWVLALLLPLAAISLGFDSFARDRERGTLAMLLAPASTGRSLLFARTAAMFAALWVGVVPAALLGALIETTDGASLFALILLLTGYVAFLSASVVVVSALSDRTATSLAVLVALWLFAGVALPLAASGMARAAYPSPDPRARLDGELAAADVFQKPSASTLDQEAAKDPELDPSLGTDGISQQNRYYMLLTRERYRRAKGATFEEERTLLKRTELLEITMWLSPSTIVAGALSSIAGSAPRERIQFLQDGDRYRAELDDFVRSRVVKNESKFVDADAWPSFRRVPRASVSPALTASVLFFALAFLLFVIGSLVFDRMELAPTREDA